MGWELATILQAPSSYSNFFLFQQNTIAGDYPCNDWRPVIAGMGVMGWELATILQTPAIVQSTFTNYTIKLLFLFQRRLIPSFDHLRSLRKTKTSVRDGDSSVNSHAARNGKVGGGGDVFMAQGHDEMRSGYYNSTLKKYIYNSQLSDQNVLPDLLRDINKERRGSNDRVPFSWSLQVDKSTKVEVMGRDAKPDFRESFRNVLIPVT